MRYRKLDENGDFSAGHGSADFFVDEPNTVAQSVLTRLRLWTGEWFLNTDEGTPYREQVLGVRKRQTAGPALKLRIASTEGVTSVDALQITTVTVGILQWRQRSRRHTARPS